MLEKIVKDFEDLISTFRDVIDFETALGELLNYYVFTQESKKIRTLQKLALNSELWIGALYETYLNTHYKTIRRNAA